jgi:hypothetical protein
MTRISRWVARAAVAGLVAAMPSAAIADPAPNAGVTTVPLPPSVVQCLAQAGYPVSAPATITVPSTGTATGTTTPAPGTGTGTPGPTPGTGPGTEQCGPIIINNTVYIIIVTVTTTTTTANGPQTAANGPVTITSGSQSPTHGNKLNHRTSRRKHVTARKRSTPHRSHRRLVRVHLVTSGEED